MAGLIDTTTGLRYGTGLIWENGLGGAGLINPSGGTPTPNIGAIFNGTGSLTVNVRQVLAAQVVFAGAGSLSVDSVLGRFFAAATFSGAGSLRATSSLSLLGSATLNGAGALSADASPANTYVTEDGTQNYVTEDGSQNYVTEA